MLDSGFWILDAFWMLSGCWMVDVGIWNLRFGAFKKQWAAH